MTVGDLAKKLWNGVLALFGKKPAQQPANPADPLKEAIAIMSQLEDLVGRLSAALTRIQSDESGKDATIAQLNSDKADLQQQLSDAEAQLVNALTPVVEQAEALSPPPPPPPPAADPTATDPTAPAV